MIIRKQNGECIEISTDFSVIDKLVLYKEFEDGELALVEMKDEGRETFHRDNGSVAIVRNMASRLVLMSGMIWSKILHYLMYWLILSVG